MKEYELFEPVRRLFCDMGYTVNAEVKDCDVTAVKDGELIIAELKRSLSVALLSQALDRQKTGADVYIAVPKPKKYSPKTFRDTLYVIKKLELGLIFVNMLGEHSYAEIVLEPQEFTPVRTNTKRRKKILDEINGRTIDNNTGGVTGRKIATAFTEKCINIACILEHFGPMTPSEIKKHGGCETCGAILYRNSYGWFDKPEKGVYSLNNTGKTGLNDYPELKAYYSEKILSYRTIN